MHIVFKTGRYRYALDIFSSILKCRTAGCRAGVDLTRSSRAFYDSIFPTAFLMGMLDSELIFDNSSVISMGVAWLAMLNIHG